jgi:hypothetical protein
MLSASEFNRALEDEEDGSGKGLLLLDLRRRSLLNHEPAIEALAKFMPYGNGLLLLLCDAYDDQNYRLSKGIFLLNV